MALTFIRNANDKKRWSQAVTLTKQRRAQRNPGDPNYDPKLKPIDNVFAYANWLYHNVLAENSSINITENEQPGIIMSEEQNTLWENIEKIVFGDSEKFKNLSEEQKWETVESIFKEYCASCNSVAVTQLDEFVNMYSGGGFGAGNRAALSGIGGFRDEAPIGPIVYGMPNNNLEKMSTTKPINVTVPSKHEPYKPEKAVIDSLGNTVADVTQSQKSKDSEDTSNDQETQQSVLDMLIDAGYDEASLETMDQEELQDAIVKIYKKQQAANQPIQPATQTLKQKIQESFLYTEDEELDEAKKISSIRKARELLSGKLRVKKANQKDGRKYLLSSDEVDKIIRSYGYKWDSKGKRWIKKLSPTYLARKILSDKFQDRSVLEKDTENQYVIDQDEVRKRMRSRGYHWNSVKLEWEHVSKNPKYKAVVAMPQPAEKPVEEPAKPVVEPETPTEPEEELPPAKSYDDDKDSPWENPNSDDRSISPMLDPSIKLKVKEMQGRFILGLAHSQPNMTVFNADEANVNTPEIEAKIVLEKVENLGYEWHGDKLTWLNSAMTLPNAVFEAGESAKSLIARGYLAAVDKVKNIRINTQGSPAIKADTLDDKMESEDFIWVPENNKWKWVGDDDTTFDESTTVLYESAMDEATKPKPLPKEKFDKVKKDYNIVDVGESQAKLLYRVIQLEHFRKNYSKKSSVVRDAAWTMIQDGGDRDPINGKLPVHIAEQTLESLGFEFNNNENLPMWVRNGNPKRMPQILSPYVSDEQEYIARGILATKRPQAISIRSTNGLNPTMNEPSQKIIQRIEGMGYSWHGDYGYIKGSNTNILSKKEQDVQNWLDQREQLEYTDMSAQDQKLFAKWSAYRQAARISGKTPAEFLDASESEQNTMLSKLKRSYDFNKDQKDWLKRDKPVSTSVMGKIGTALKYLTQKGFSAIGSAAKKIGSELKNVGQYN